MRTDDIKKLDEIGFMVFRAQDYPNPMIMWFKHDHWEKFNGSGVFKTIDERDRALEQLHLHFNVILD